MVLLPKPTKSPRALPPHCIHLIALRVSWVFRITSDEFVFVVMRTIAVILLENIRLSEANKTKSKETNLSGGTLPKSPLGRRYVKEK